MEPTRIDRVLVALRPRPGALPPAAYLARLLAEQLGCGLTLLSVIYESSVGMRAGFGDERARVAQQGLIDAERLALERIAGSIRDWGVSTEIDVRWHHPTYEAVIEAADEHDADLVAVDVLDPHPALHPRLTDTDWQLMRRCRRPLLYINDPEVAGYETVLAAVDPLHVGPDTDATDRAVLTHAAALARAFGAKLRLVHAYPDLGRYPWVSAVQVKPGVFYGTENVVEVHRDAVQALADELGIAAEAIDLRPGEPVDVIEDVAAEHNVGLIVVGALARGDLEQALLGSTAEAVTAEAGRDVLLVKAERSRGEP